MSLPHSAIELVVSVIVTLPGHSFFGGFNLILYFPVNNFSVMYLGCTSTKQRLMCLVQGHKAVFPERLEPEIPRS